MSTLNERICFEAMARADIREVPGAKSNPVILGWLKDIIPGFGGSDATAWCSAYVLAVVKAAGAELGKHRSPSAAARSWRRQGVGIPLEAAMAGDIGVLSRPGGASWQGHVIIICRHTSRYVVGLGGNQGNRSGVKRFPIGRLIEVRRLHAQATRTLTDATI